MITTQEETTMSLINTQVKPFKATAYADGKFIDVSDVSLKGKWSVLMFYPADFTFVCPTELEDLADCQPEFGWVEHQHGPLAHQGYVADVNEFAVGVGGGFEWFDLGIDQGHGGFLLGCESLRLQCTGFSTI